MGITLKLFSLDEFFPPVKTPTVSIKTVLFTEGQIVTLLPTDVVVIVGPNNAGKSATLRAIKDKLSNSASQNPIVQSITIDRFGSVTDVRGLLSGRKIRHTNPAITVPQYNLFGASINELGLDGSWKTTNQLGPLTRLFCHLLSADQRLKVSEPAENFNVVSGIPNNPIQFLVRDDKLEARLSARFRKAFNVDLILHRNAGAKLPLYAGQRPTIEAGEDRVSLSYIQRLEKLTPLHEQGDGMRSFAGVLLATSVGHESILLIDEPEAFLHPPQARLLGTSLVQDRKQETQLFIATHSTDILRGVLDSESTDVKVIRIQREGDTNKVRLLSNERIKELWGDPLLRYSNILDGLFHEMVVLGESDSDCRFYAATLDATLPAGEEGKKRPDLMFTHCGGKQRLPVVIRALREVDVPVRVVADFDVLSAEYPLKAIVESLGLDWSKVETDWRVVKSGVDGKKAELSTIEAKSAIDKIIDNVKSSTFTTAAVTEIQTVLKRTSAWSNAKEAGRAFVPSGDASKACDRLLTTLRSAGLFVVEVGELEGFVRSEGGHGPKWVNAVLERPLATDPELEMARRFVTDLVAPPA